jgi:2'-5' RNA ligase
MLATNPLNLRLFTGIAIPPAIARTLEETQALLRPLVPLRWSPLENLHITTRFIGAWPEDRLPSLQSTLAAIPPAPSFPVTVGGFGFLPATRHPKIFYAAVDGGPPLTALAAATDRALSTIGLEPEQRPYTAHLTLARIRDENLTALRAHISADPQPRFGTFPVTEFHLYSSHPGPAHSTYSILSTYPLTGDAS